MDIVSSRPVISQFNDPAGTDLTKTSKYPPHIQSAPIDCPLDNSQNNIFSQFHNRCAMIHIIFIYVENCLLDIPPIIYWIEQLLVCGSRRHRHFPKSVFDGAQYPRNMKNIFFLYSSRLPVKQEDLGDRNLKGFDQPVRVYRVMLQPGASIAPPAGKSHPRQVPGFKRLWMIVVAIGLVVLIGAAALWLTPRPPRVEQAKEMIRGGIVPADNGAGTIKPQRTKIGEQLFQQH
ncbi:MAG: hypothetical protein MAG794_01502 [Gammaproteobacteria bacterium]|nr:hypothetical protein [Gammaproteobacteria bacterium]